ncbi:MAG: hypothetical protein L0229_01960 [Blastocatellia bacterium]|nr:hypothetical protein [Blastocatellia bacterium]
MSNVANCGEQCEVHCPEGQTAWCQYQCDNEGGCVCRGGCSGTHPGEFLLPEDTFNIYEALKGVFPVAPIDPIGPFIMTYPKMRLWQLAYILSAVTNQEILFPASRAFEEVPEFDRFESTYSEVLEQFHLKLSGDPQVAA